MNIECEAKESLADRRYEFVHCTGKCQREWQRIDYGCAAHHLVCDSQHILSGKDAR